MQTLKNSKNIPVYLSDLQLVRECYVGVDQGSLRGGGGSMGGGVQLLSCNCVPSLESQTKCYSPSPKVESDTSPVACT